MKKRAAFALALSVAITSVFADSGAVYSQELEATAEPEAILETESEMAIPEPAVETEAIAETEPETAVPEPAVETEAVAEAEPETAVPEPAMETEAIAERESETAAPEPAVETEAVAETETSAAEIVSETNAEQAEEEELILEPDDTCVEWTGNELPVLPAAADDMDIVAAIDENNFPDANFRAWVTLDLDMNCDGQLSQDEAGMAESVFIKEKGIEDLTGIEYLQNLTDLDCSGNKLTSLDMSGNTRLSSLVCNDNQLTSLNVSSNKFLTNLVCDNNQLTALDLSGNRDIFILSCNNNQLTSLDLSNIPWLSRLECDNNQLTSLNVSTGRYAGGLDSLSCENNKLTTLTTGQNDNLRSLYCSGNQLTSLDVSYSEWLEYLSCGDNQLTSLDLRRNTELTTLYCTHNQLTSLDTGSNTELKNLSCYSNQLTSLDVSNNTKLESLSCESNQLMTLDLSMCRNLKYVYLSYQKKEIELKDTDAGLELDMAELVGANNLTKISDLKILYGDALQMGGDGIMLFSKDDFPGSISYSYDTGKEDESLSVTLNLHSYQTVTSKEPTCTEDGLTFEECIECHQKKEGSEKSIPALGHTGGKATCAEKAVCTRCGQAYGELGTVHSYQTVTSKEPTCTEDGLTFEECIECHQKKEGSEKPIPALGHTGGKATCAAQAVCARCGQAYGELGKVHNYGKYKITKEPTVLTEGTETRTCAICGVKESRPVEKIPATIELNVTSIKLKVKQSTSKIKVSGLAPGDEVVSWKSSNSKIVTVNKNGKITAKSKKGQATVTVTLKSGLSKKIKVTVQKNAVACTKVTLNKKTVTLKKGKTFTLKPSVKPITCVQKVKYKSSNKSVVTVSGGGKIKAKRKGTATITVTVGKKKATCKVKVK